MQSVNFASSADTEFLDTRVQSLYSKLLGIPSAADKHLTRCSISDLLNKSNTYKRTWLRQAEIVIKTAQSHVRAAHEQRIRDIFLMRQQLRLWLSGPLSYS
jgi:hypothetical protein